MNRIAMTYGLEPFVGATNSILDLSNWVSHRDIWIVIRGETHEATSTP